QTRASRYARRSTAGTPRRARAPRLYSAARAGPGRPAVEAPGEPRTPAPAQEAGPGNGPDTRPRPGCTRDGCARTAATDHAGPAMNPQVESFHDPATGTFSHLVYDHDGGHAAIIDPVMDFEPASARIAYDSARRLLDAAHAHSLAVEWIL